MGYEKVKPLSKDQVKKQAGGYNNLDADKYLAEQAKKADKLRADAKKK